MLKKVKFYSKNLYIVNAQKLLKTRPIHSQIVRPCHARPKGLTICHIDS